MSASKRSSAIQPNNAGCLFWLAVIVVILVLFVLNWGKIQETLTATKFMDIIKNHKGTETTTGQGSPNSQTKPNTIPPASPGQKGDGSADPSDLPAATPASGQKPPQATSPSTATPSGSTATKVPTPSSGGAAGTSSQSGAAGSGQQSGAAGTNSQSGSKPQAAVQKTRTTSLYFVRIDEDGVIVRQEVKRQMPASDSPLTDSINALLTGPNEDELRRKLVSLVPEGTKLLSARVRGSTAYLDFNEAFMYNHYGIEGYAGQLKQIVYTATSFPTVQDVQILIEGQKRDYLGEGIYIGSPLGRNSFQ
jgi:spore germination protein GerM